MLLLGLALVMTEVFVPSGGILGVLAFTAIVVAIYFIFYLLVYLPRGAVQ